MKKCRWELSFPTVAELAVETSDGDARIKRCFHSSICFMACSLCCVPGPGADIPCSLHTVTERQSYDDLSSKQWLQSAWRGCTARRALVRGRSPHLTRAYRVRGRHRRPGPGPAASDNRSCLPGSGGGRDGSLGSSAAGNGMRPIKELVTRMTIFWPDFLSRKLIGITIKRLF
jgi:hypothetical protein